MINSLITLVLCFALLFSNNVNCNQDYLELTRVFETDVQDHSPSQYVSDQVWQEVRDFIIPNDHPIKYRLDAIFSASRAFYDFQSMEAAGFTATIPQHHTGIIVTRHPELKGYVIKAYLDIQEYHSGKPEYYFWKKRAIGAQLIRKSIEEHNYGHLLKVPQKWLYLIPDDPAPLPGLPKMFILVEEDMDIYDSETNKELWGSQIVTKKLLKSFYNVITELGLFDCAKPDNCPISKDGRVAFVDTQCYHFKKVKYHKLTPYLSPSMKKYWKKLIKDGEIEN